MSERAAQRRVKTNGFAPRTGLDGRQTEAVATAFRVGREAP